MTNQRAMRARTLWGKKSIKLLYGGLLLGQIDLYFEITIGPSRFLPWAASVQPPFGFITIILELVH